MFQGMPCSRACSCKARPGILFGSPGTDWQWAPPETRDPVWITREQLAAGSAGGWDPALALQPRTQDSAWLLQGEQWAQLNPARLRAAGSNSTGRESSKEAQAGSTSRGTQAGNTGNSASSSSSSQPRGEAGKALGARCDPAPCCFPSGVTMPRVCSLVCAELAGSCSGAARWDLLCLEEARQDQPRAICSVGSGW